MFQQSYGPPFLMPYGTPPARFPPGRTPAATPYPYGSHVTSSSPPHHLLITCFCLVIPDFPECLPPIILAPPYHLLYLQTKTLVFHSPKPGW